MRLGLPVTSNYVVINCDFEKYMWDPAAAGCLAGQLTTFIKNRGITDMLVITHSNGGNVLRWMLSNPTYDSRYPGVIKAIRWVDAATISASGLQGPFELRDLRVVDQGRMFVVHRQARGLAAMR